MSQNTDIDLYSGGTPNGHKISVTLEELGVKYNAHNVDITKNAQKEDWFLKINPNGRIPAIIDNTSGKQKRIFEGASIQLYLAAKYDKDHKISFPYDSDEYWEMVEWMVWLQSGKQDERLDNHMHSTPGNFEEKHADESTRSRSGIGPMQGQANHFYRYAPERIEYGIKRYQTETKRLYQVLNDRLAQQQAAGQGLWIVGGKFTIADISCFSWINWAAWAGVDTKPFPEIEKWLEAIQNRPAVERGVNVPVKFEMRDKMKDAKKADEYAKEQSGWIMQGMKDDAEKHK